MTQQVSARPTNEHIKASAQEALRYAIYYTPPADHPLTRSAASWLGRDAFDVDGHGTVPSDVLSTAMISEPRRYGFHATLKAPFRLAPGTSRQELEAAIRKYAQRRPPCPIGPLQVTMLGRFFALAPRKPAPFLQGFAGQIVSEFDRFRAPMTSQDLQRRLTSALDEEEMTNLVRWGYPYVFDRFRFHMTLSGPVPAEERESVMKRLKGRFEPLLDEDFHVDAITLFEQRSPDSDFVATSRFAFRPTQLEIAVNER